VDSCLTFDPEAQHVPETTTRLTNDCGSMTLVSGQRVHRHTYGTADMTYVVNTGDWSTLRVCHWQAQQRSAMVNITCVPDVKINFAMVGVSRLGRTALHGRSSVVDGRAEQLGDTNFPIAHRSEYAGTQGRSPRTSQPRGVMRVQVVGGEARDTWRMCRGGLDVVLELLEAGGPSMGKERLMAANRIRGQGSLAGAQRAL
jgi:hypothetical protein